MLPNLIGLGAQKCGSSWLDAQLRGHSEVSMAVSRKEVHFFDRYFDKGVEWYESFFLPEGGEKIIGDITPGYLYAPDAARKIKDVLGEVRFVLILREPVSRTLSQFRMYRQKRGRTNTTLSEAIAHHSGILNYSYYSQYVRSYVDIFGLEAIHVGIYEEIFHDPSRHLSDLSDFLGIDPQGFDLDRMSAVVGDTKQARSDLVYSSFVKLARKLRDNDLEKIVAWGRTLKPILLKKGRYSEDCVTSKDLTYLQSLFERETKELEKLLKIDLSIWNEAR